MLFRDKPIIPKKSSQCEYLSLYMPTSTSAYVMGIPKDTYFCGNAGTCPDITNDQSKCPLVDIAREQVLMVSGKMVEGNYYEWVESGWNKEAKMKTFSLLRKGMVKAEYKNRVKEEEKDPLEKVLER